MWFILSVMILSADPVSTVHLEINIARIQNNVLPLERDDRLDHAAELQTEWLRYAYRNKINRPSDHVCSSKWLFDIHPELDWVKLFATYGGVLPDWLGAFDLSRLCGFNGLVIDNGTFGGRNDSAVDAWLGSPFHRDNLLREDWTSAGVSIGKAGSNFATFGYFGKISN